MLVIASDLHLTEGSSGQTIHVGAFRVFTERLRQLAFDASWRVGGTSKPIQELSAMFLGGILDLIRSIEWLTEPDAPGYVRSWDDLQGPQFIDKVSAIMDSGLQRNADCLAIPKSLNDGVVVSLCSSISEIRAVCANQRPYGSVRGCVKDAFFGARCCIRNEGGSFGAGAQAQASNTSKLLPSNGGDGERYGKSVT